LKRCDRAAAAAALPPPMAALAATMHAAALTLLLISSAHAVPDVAAPPTVAPGPIVRGAALNGLLALEDWFFSWHEGLPAVVPFPFDEVASPPTLPQGRSFPSHKLSSDLIDPWLSEGALIVKSAVRNGANTTVDALTAHRESYITEYDFAQMASVGVEHVRLAVGWWVFASNPLPARAGLLPDPCYPDLQFVTVSAGMLETILKQGQRHGVKFLIDMHAMPCGSSDGTYNGVFPRNPQFFSNTTAKAIGLGVIRNMLSWYKDLPADLQSTVWAFTLLNEPGLGRENGNFFEFSLCLSRACLGKMIVFIYKWLKNAVFRRGRRRWGRYRREPRAPRKHRASKQQAGACVARRGGAGLQAGAQRTDRLQVGCDAVALHESA